MYKISIIWIIFIMLFFAICDTTILNNIKIYDVKPDLFLIAVLFFALYGGLKTGLLAGFIAGLARDIFGGGPFGVNILFLSLVGIFFGYHFSKFYREKPYAQALLSFLLSIAYLFFYFSFLKFTGNKAPLPALDIGAKSALLNLGIPFSLYTAIVAPALFFVLHKIFRLRY